MRLLVILCFAAPWVWSQSTDKARRSFDKGREAYRTFTVKGYERAIRYFSDALTESPNFTDAHAAIAETYVLLGYELEKAAGSAGDAYDKAIREARVAIEKDSTSVYALRAMAHVSYVCDGKAKGEANYELLQRALQIDSTDAECWYLLWLLTDNENPNGIIQKALQFDPRSYMAHYAVGLTYARLKNWDSAADHYHKCIDLVEDNYLAYFALGNLLSQQKQYLSSIDPYEKALRYGVPGHDVHLYLGLSYYYTDSNKKAKRQLKTYLDGNPTTPLKNQLLEILKEID